MEIVVLYVLASHVFGRHPSLPSSESWPKSNQGLVNYLCQGPARKHLSLRGPCGLLHTAQCWWKRPHVRWAQSISVYCHHASVFAWRAWSELCHWGTHFDVFLKNICFSNDCSYIVICKHIIGGSHVPFAWCPH